MKLTRLLTPSALAAALAATSAARAEDGPLIVPVVRVAMGPAIHFDPGRVVTNYALDVTAGADAFAGSLEGPAGLLGGELGYAFDTWGLHLFTVGPSLGVGNVLGILAYQPRFLVGTDELSNLALGMRNSLSAHMLADIFSLEIGHQFVHARDALHHDLHIMAGVNLAAPIFYLVAAVEGLDRALH